MTFVLPGWYAIAVLWAVSAIVLGSLLIVAIGIADVAISRLWRFLKLERVVIAAIWKHVRSEQLAAEATEAGKQ